MFFGFVLLILFQLLGEFLTKILHLPLPGPVTGMIMLFLALCLFPKLYSFLGKTSHFLLKNMSLFFVPAGVGIIAIWSKIQINWIALTCILFFSTLMTMGVSSFLFQKIGKERKE